MIRLAVMVISLIALASCKHENSGFCANNPGEQGCPDAADHGDTCQSNANCTTMAFPVCDTANKTCVQCLEGMTMACSGTTPVCKNSKCTACTQHADCTRSNACLSDGSC